MDRPELDPEIAIFVERMSADWAKHPPFATLPIEEARRVAEEVRAPWRESGPEMAHTTEHFVPTSTGPLRVRLYDPGSPPPLRRSSICTEAGSSYSASTPTID